MNSAQCGLSADRCTDAQQGRCVLIGEANPSRTMRCFMALPGALEVSTATSHQAFDVCQERVDPKPSGSSELLIVSRSILEAVDL